MAIGDVHNIDETLDTNMQPLIGPGAVHSITESTLAPEQPQQPGFWHNLALGTAHAMPAIGATVGGAIPALFAPETGGTSLIGEPAAIGLGTAGGVSLENTILSAMGEPTPNVLGTAGQAAKEGIMTGGIAGIGGAAITKGAEALSGTGDSIANGAEWMQNRIGQSFIKASQKLNAYGHNPIQAIPDENLYSNTWKGLLGKIKDAYGNIGEMFQGVFAKNNPNVNIDNAIAPLDKAISELKDFPGVNASTIKRVSVLKKDIQSYINKNTTVVENYEAVPGKQAPIPTAGTGTPDNWITDMLSPINEEHGMTVPNKSVAAPVNTGMAQNKQVQPHWYNESAANETGDITDEVVDTVHTKTDRYMTAEQANNIKKKIYTLARYTGNDSDDKIVNKAVQYVAAKINATVQSAVPEIKPLNIRWGNLSALDKAANARAVVASRNNPLGIPEFAAAGALLHGNVGTALSIETGGRLLNTPIGASAAMKGLGNIANAARNTTVPELASKVGTQLSGTIAAEAQDNTKE